MNFSGWMALTLMPSSAYPAAITFVKLRIAVKTRTSSGGSAHAPRRAEGREEGSLPKS